MEYDFEDTKFVSSSPGLKASSEALLSAICMMHVGLGFEAYLTTIRKTGKYVKDVTNVFLCDHLMKSISSVIFDLQVKLEQQWKDYPVGCLG